MAVNLADLRRLSPLSRNWGYDRGLPVDRYFIERFLAQHAGDVHGRVLEVGDATYTHRYGAERVTRSDVLNDTDRPGTTIVADLQSAPHIADDSFDCVILTQTLQLVYEPGAALQTVHRILRSQGVLLATMPGISPIMDSPWTDQWCWSFTRVSLRRLMIQRFAPDSFRVEGHGNVLTATAFLYGLAAEELTTAELDFDDPAYDVTIAVRATKP